jgi:hypothetical protein
VGARAVRADAVQMKGQGVARGSEIVELARKGDAEVEVEIGVEVEVEVEVGVTAGLRVQGWGGKHMHERIPQH